MKPRPDPRFAEVVGLGELKKIYKQDLPPTLGILAFACLGAWEGVGDHLLDNDPYYPHGLQLGLAILLSGITLAYWRVWHGRRRMVALYERGFAYHDGEAMVQVSWEGIMDTEIRPKTGKGLMRKGQGAVDYIIHTSGEKEVCLPERLAGFPELWATISWRLISA